MGYLIEPAGTSYALSTTVILKETDLQTMGTTGILIYTADGINTVVPIACYMHAVDSTLGTAYTGMQTLKLVDGATMHTLCYGYMDILVTGSGTLDSGSVYSFNCPVNNGGTPGSRTVNNRDIYLKANTNPLTGTGDYTLTLFYFLIPKF